MAQSSATPHVKALPAEAYTSGWWGQVWHLVVWNLFLQSRRLQSSILVGIFLGGYLICQIFLIISHVLLSGSVSRLQDPAQVLAFPASLQFSYGYLSLLAPLLLCILAGTFVGSEYGYGMHRQLLTRGLTRNQVLTAQLIALALIALGLVAITIILALVVGFLLGPLFGFAPAVLPLRGWLGVLLSWLTQSLRYFLYMLIAVFAATVGRSILAGVGFSLGYLFFEFLSTTLLYGLLGGLSARVATIIVDFTGSLPGIVSNELNGYANTLITGTNSVHTLPLSIALLVTLGYVLFFLLATFLIYHQSDIFD